MCRNRTVAWLTAKRNLWHWISMLVECKMSRKKTKRTVLIHLYMPFKWETTFECSHIAIFLWVAVIVSNIRLNGFKLQYYGATIELFFTFDKKKIGFCSIFWLPHTLYDSWTKRTPMNTALSCPHSGGNSTYTFLCRGWSVLFLHCDMSRLCFPFTQNTPE